MIFSRFARDVITIIKSDGNKIESIKANVQKDMVFIHDKNIPLETDDEILRILPSGVVESYIVLDPGFYHGGNGLPGGYQANVQRKPKSMTTDSNNTHVYHINASNSNINVNTSNSNITNKIDNSNNVFTQIRKEINSKVNENDKTMILGKLSELEKSVGTNQYQDKLTDFISLSANITTIMLPFLPTLQALIS